MLLSVGMTEKDATAARQAPENAGTGSHPLAVGPLGYNMVKMPAGAPFAVLDTPDAKWPAEAGKKAGYQMRGYTLDAKQRPAFRYSFQNISVEDAPVAVSGELDAGFRRAITLRADKPVANFYFRAWSGTTVEQKRNGTFLADGKVTFRFTGAGTPVVRGSGKNVELIVPVAFQKGEAKFVEEINW